MKRSESPEQSGSSPPKKIYHAASIGTHDGVFHCDEALACYMLKLLPEYKEAVIVRTRDPEKLDECDIVVDVGAVFDHEKKRYDHHQREFDSTLSSLRPDLGPKYVIKLSSAGLIYTHYGERVIKTLCPEAASLSPKDLILIFKKVYEDLIEEIDAIDNGVPMTDEKPKYSIHTHISARVGRMNPEWNSKAHINLNDQFKKAMTLVGKELVYTVNYLLNVWLPARTYVKDAISKRFEIHESGQILLFTERFPWKQHLFDLEGELEIKRDIKNSILYVIFNDKPNSWRVQAVPVDVTSFVLRKPLKREWWGVRDEVLSEVSGIEDCIFCHSTGFIGGAKTKEGALKMAVVSLNSA
ncbi:UPF0160 protein C27H6.8 [Phthorimaea operculella]|nr:UPF0160 protein C27H6.8 [Phthorimaea operculella]